MLVGKKGEEEHFIVKEGDHTWTTGSQTSHCRQCDLGHPGSVWLTPWASAGMKKTTYPPRSNRLKSFATSMLHSQGGA